MAESKSKPKTAFKPPKRPTPERLANIALHHLERFATSADNLRRVLERRVLRAQRHYDDLHMDQVKSWIDDIIHRYQDAGLLNDQTYAEGRARALMRKGVAGRRVKMTLKEKGVDDAVIDQALDALADEHGDVELSAAINLARRRRFGPFADPSKRAELRDKHLAALARAGFSYDIAKRVVDADDVDALDPPQ